jgi:predicted secreted hydrolase
MRFPEDHGPHPEFRTEWWYLTGNLATDAGRRFGDQITLFRIALTATRQESDSAWSTNQVYMGHFAISDIADNRHIGFERFSRGAVGLAGAQATPFRVWLENWSLTGSDGGLFPLQVRVSEGEAGIDLLAESSKPPVLQGERGLSRKSADPGNASYYYSFTRIPTSGTLHLDGTAFKVRGTSWLDREWSTSALSPDQSGWDWFALQLDDGRDLMYYQLRRIDGKIDPHSSGVLVASDGTARNLHQGDVQALPGTMWRSGDTGASYPITWQLRVPEEDLELNVVARIEDQEMDGSVRYWEGAVSVEGIAAGKPVTGEGYLEMTGY